jgi:hypothetical protein
VIVGSDQFYAKVDMKLSTGRRVECLPGYSCPYGDVANVWKCWSGAESVCMPVGDFRSGIEITEVDTKNRSEGVRIRYGGGLGDYETEVLPFENICRISRP